MANRVASECEARYSELSKGDDTFVIRFWAGDELRARRKAIEYAGSNWLGFDWKDAAEMAKDIGRSQDISAK